jgi:hypothetical protein
MIRCIQGLVNFAQPILDMICDATGWKCTLVAGGPEPAHGGRLNIIRYLFHGFITFDITHRLMFGSIHSGTTTGDIKMNFGRAERLRYKKYFIAMYGDFLQKCYCKFCSLLFPCTRN